MPRPPTLPSIAWIPALLVLAGLWGMALETWRKRQVKTGRLEAIALRVHVGAALLALLVAASLFGALGPARPHLLESAGTWLEIGRGLALRADLVLDHAGGAALCAGLGLGLLIELSAAGRPRALPRLSLALAGLSLGVVGESLVLVALGWHLCALAALPAAGEDVGGRGGALAVSELGLWIALGAVFSAAGVLGVAHVARTAALGANSPLLTIEVAGASLAAITALGVGVAVLGRALALPLGGERPLRALLAGPAMTLVAAMLLLRLAPVLTLAPSSGWILGGLGDVAVLVGGMRALGAEDREGANAGAGLLLAGLLLVAAAAHGWSAVIGLALCGAAAQATRVLATGRRGAWAQGIAEVGLVIGLGHAAAILAATAWPFTAALPIAAAGVFGVVAGRRPASPTQEDLGEVIPTIGAGLAAVAAATLPLVDPATLDRWVAPVILPATIAPAQGGPVAGMAGVAALVLALGWALGRRRPPWAAAAAPRPQGVGRLRQLLRAPAAAALGLAELGDLARARLALRLWLAGAPRRRTGALLGLLTGLLLALGAVYCNPQVLRIGPSRVHPVDLGGLDPVIVAPKKSGREAKLDAGDLAAAAAAAAEKAAEGGHTE